MKDKDKNLKNLPDMNPVQQRLNAQLGNPQFDQEIARLGARWTALYNYDKALAATAQKMKLDKWCILAQENIKKERKQLMRQIEVQLDSAAENGDATFLGELSSYLYRQKNPHDARRYYLCVWRDFILNSGFFPDESKWPTANAIHDDLTVQRLSVSLNKLYGELDALGFPYKKKVTRPKKGVSPKTVGKVKAN